jgi:hypothetical protein
MDAADEHGQDLRFSIKKSVFFRADAGYYYSLERFYA